MMMTVKRRSRKTIIIVITVIMKIMIVMVVMKGYPLVAFFSKRAFSSPNLIVSLFTSSSHSFSGLPLGCTTAVSDLRYCNLIYFSIQFPSEHTKIYVC